MTIFVKSGVDWGGHVPPGTATVVEDPVPPYSVLVLHKNLKIFLIKNVYCPCLLNFTVVWLGLALNPN